MKVSIFFVLSTSLLFAYSANAQGVHKNQIVKYADSSRKKVIIRELQVFDLHTASYIPYTRSAELFATKNTVLGIRYYNFGCMKTPPSGEPWEGQIGRDERNNVIFREPIYGIRALLKLSINKISKGENTLYKFFKSYTACADCAVKKVEVDGKFVCPEGKSKLEIYATHVAKALDIGIHDVISVKNSNGEYNIRLLTLLLSEIVEKETGENCKFEEETIRRAIDLL